MISRGSHARQLRIIGGSWRGRRLRFPDVEDLRPTPDRVRETLFNWLGARVHGARCLDLFAGSGALGLEALSRGAAEVVFVERNTVAARALRELLTEWGAQNARVERANALTWLEGTSRPFDIVFIDPPFTAELHGEAARRLEARGWLAPQARVYLEAPAREALPELPSQWQPLKAKQTGEVGYHLYERTATRSGPA